MADIILAGDISGSVTIAAPAIAGTTVITLPATTGTLISSGGALGTPSSGTLTNCTGLPVAGGGTGVATTTAYGVLAGGTTATGAFQNIGTGTATQVLTSNGAGALPTFQAASGGVTTFNGSTTGLTPATATSGAITLGGTLAVANGGTGVTTSTGTGATVRGTSPTLTTPNIGTASATAISMSGLITGQASTATDVNTANDTGALSCRSDGTATTVASMSFHRPGAYAINMGLGADNVFRIGGWSASNNCFQLDGSGNATILGNIKFNSGYGSAATAYGCRAWVNFNGTGTPAIRASGNVSSITDNGTGNYTVNFTTAMSDVNFGVALTAGSAGSFGTVAYEGNAGSSPVRTTSSVRFETASNNGTTLIDDPTVSVAIFR